MPSIDDLSDAIKSQIEAKGYKLDEVELLEMRGRFDPEHLGSFCEGVFQTKDGTYFKCGQGTTGSPYQKRAGLLVTHGTKLYEITEDDAKAWLANPDLSIYPEC